MINGNAEEYLELLKEDIQNIVCSETQTIEGLLPHLVHYKYEQFLQGICDDNCLTCSKKELSPKNTMLNLKEMKAGKSIK